MGSGLAAARRPGTTTELINRIQYDAQTFCLMEAVRAATSRPTGALTRARTGWQPAATGKMDAAYFAGFWLRQQRIGTRGI
jgi:hypothetical protein